MTLENSGGETTVRVARVVRGKSSTTTEIPFETEEREDPEAEKVPRRSYRKASPAPR